MHEHRRRRLMIGKHKPERPLCPEVEDGDDDEPQGHDSSDSSDSTTSFYNDDDPFSAVFVDGNDDDSVEGTDDGEYPSAYQYLDDDSTR